MKKINFLSLFLLSICGSAYAGGGAPSWSPSIEPSNCIVSKSIDNGGWSWHGSPQCNEVIERNYALGVRYNGQFIYQDGSSINFDTIITPDSWVHYDHRGKKLKDIVSHGASWER
ncbi:hypothetical protein G3142_005587 [Salmonella enterica subsp. enterica serovar Montevideo]|nr:hypothetical protein [Salmonella enterica subsp. enterica serovar Montevideo]EEK7814419.1 hypothetical protein [Salmonella enterica subsp. enterica serovar Montevideo]